MAYFKCIGGSGGGEISEIVRMTEIQWNKGGGTTGTGYKYEIITTATGGYDAAIKVKQYDGNNILLQEVDITYTDVVSTSKIIDDIEISYPSDWVVKVAEGCIIDYNDITYNSGEQILTWSYGTTVDYTNLTSFEYLPYPAENNKIYLITNKNGDMVKYQYQGSRRLLRKQNISDYEFWYEDLFFPIGMSNSSTYSNYYGNYWINTNVMLNSTENRGKDWQLEFNVTPNRGYGSSSELPVVGSNTNQNCNFEFYIDTDSYFKLYGDEFNNDNCGNVDGKDVIISCQSGTLTVSVDGTVVVTKNFSPSSDDNTNYIYISNYRGNYCFSGMMNYIGFKWLS